MGFGKSGAEGSNSSFVVLSSLVRAEGILLSFCSYHHFLYLYSAAVTGGRNSISPTFAKPCSLVAIKFDTIQNLY